MSDDEARAPRSDTHGWWALLRTEWSGNVAIVAFLIFAAILLLVLLL